MVFSSSTFIFMFLPIVLIGYYLINPQYRNIFLLIVSLVFYAFTEPRFVVNAPYPVPFLSFEKLR